MSVRNRLEAYDDGPNSTYTLGSAMCLQYQCRCVYFTNNTMYMQQKYVYIVTCGPYLRLDFATCIIRLVDRTKRERESVDDGRFTLIIAMSTYLNLRQITKHVCGTSADYCLLLEVVIELPCV